MVNVVVSHMTLGELLKRKAELEEVRAVLEEHNLEQVYQELGELGYLIGKEMDRYAR